MYDFSHLTSSINSFLSSRMGGTGVMLIEMSIVGVLAISIFAFLGLFLVYMERKVAAFMQIRLGPNRVGYKGSLQTLADTIKLLFKEGYSKNFR
jgi:NADH-quinone oxidoreductase subunit H